MSISAFIRKFNQAFTEGDKDFILASITDDIRFDMIGSPSIEGKEAFAQMVADMAGDNLPSIRLNAIITHGSSAVAEGRMTMKDESGKEKTYAFCDLYELSGFKNPKVKAMTSYMLELPEVAAKAA